MEEIEVMFPEFKALIDTVEQEISRPKNKQKCKTHYSGKKGRHAVKTQLTVNSNGLIVHKASHVRGSTHDYSLYKRSSPHLPSKVRQGFDIGHLEVKAVVPGLIYTSPFKKKSPRRGKIGVKAEELSTEQKVFNRALASERAVVEHTNRWV